MQLKHRGLTIELPDDDPRIPIFEALLFGRALPPPLPAPAIETPPSAPAAPSRVKVPANWLRFWRALGEPMRKELVVLTKGPATAHAIEVALGIEKGDLNGTNTQITRVAHAHGLGRILGRRGRGR